MRKLIISFVMTFIIGSSAYAGINTGTFSISPFLGGYTFDSEEDMKTRPVSGLRLGYDFTRHWGVEGVFEYLRTEYSRAPVIEANPDVYGYRLEGLYHFMPESRLVPHLAFGFGGRSADYKDLPLDRNNFDVDYGIGLKYFLYDNLAIRGDVRHIFLTNDSLNNLEYTVGISYYFGGPKPMPMQAEATATEAAAPSPPKERPALPSPLNLSATAVSPSRINLGWDKVDAASGYKIYRDGVFLTSSRIASAPDTGLKTGTLYCYKVTATDDEGRESVESNEDCAKTETPPPPPPLPAPIDLTASPESESRINVAWNRVAGASGYKIYRDGAYLTSRKAPPLSDGELKADTRYCYRATSTDDTGRESVLSNESCAATPAPTVLMEEKKPAAESAVAKEMFEKGRATINIEFDTGKALVKTKYHDEIKKFADVMREHPDLKVVIEGHTDGIGNKALNQRLSQKRAESVKDYMVKKFGIDESRLSATGYGMTKPIASNKTAKGKQKNRRVEAVVDYTIKK